MILNDISNLDRAAAAEAAACALRQEARCFTGRRRTARLDRAARMAAIANDKLDAAVREEGDAS